MGHRSERRTGKRGANGVMYTTGAGQQPPPIEFEDEINMSNLNHHPRVPEDCPGINQDGERFFFQVSWSDEELDLAEAHQYDDVYTVIGSICFWWATRQGDHELAQQWADWMEECVEADEDYEEEDLVD